MIPARFALAVLPVSLAACATTRHESVELETHDAFHSPATAPREGTITLRAHDPLGWSFSVRDGVHGTILQDDEVRSRDSMIGFDAYDADSLSVGIQGAEDGAILDLGPIRELGTKLAVQETVGGGQAWAALRWDGTSLVVAAPHRETRAWSPDESDTTWPGERGHAHAAVHLGHAYVVHLASPDRDAVVAKLIVTAHEPRVSVTLRWVRMSPDEPMPAAAPVSR